MDTYNHQEKDLATAQAPFDCGTRPFGRYERLYNRRIQKKYGERHCEGYGAWKVKIISLLGGGPRRTGWFYRYNCNKA